MSQIPDLDWDSLAYVIHSDPALRDTSETLVNTDGFRDYGPFVKECAKRGLGRTRAYALANAGMLDTDYVGKSRIVYLDSLLSLPQRLKEAANDAGRS